MASGGGEGVGDGAGDGLFFGEGLASGGEGLAIGGEGLASGGDGLLERDRASSGEGGSGQRARRRRRSASMLRLILARLLFRFCLSTVEIRVVLLWLGRRGVVDGLGAGPGAGTCLTVLRLRLRSSRGGRVNADLLAGLRNRGQPRTPYLGGTILGAGVEGWWQRCGGGTAGGFGRFVGGATGCCL